MSACASRLRTHYRGCSVVCEVGPETVGYLVEDVDPV